MPNALSESALAVRKHTTSAIGSPQNKADSPRTSRPSDRKSSALGAGSGMAQLARAMQLETQVGVLLQTALVIIEEPHGFGGFHPVGLDGLVDLRLHLPLQLILVVLDRRPGSPSGGFIQSALMASSICAFICRFSSFSSYWTEARHWTMVQIDEAIK